METRSHHLLKSIFLILFVIAFAIGGYFWWQAREAAKFQEMITKLPMKVEVVNTPHENNLLVPPAGFPSDIPVEAGHLVSSNLTTFTQGGAKQGSITFISRDTLEAKYALYFDYMKKAGYTVTEAKNGEVLALSGTKAGANLNIVVSPAISGTKVQITHLSYTR